MNRKIDITEVLKLIWNNKVKILVMGLICTLFFGSYALISGAGSEEDTQSFYCYENMIYIKNASAEMQAGPVNSFMESEYARETIEKEYNIDFEADNISFEVQYSSDTSTLLYYVFSDNEDACKAFLEGDETVIDEIVQHFNPQLSAISMTKEKTIKYGCPKTNEFGYEIVETEIDHKDHRYSLKHTLLLAFFGMIFGICGAIAFYLIKFSLDDRITNTDDIKDVIKSENVTEINTEHDYSKIYKLLKDKKVIAISSVNSEKALENILNVIYMIYSKLSKKIAVLDIAIKTAGDMNPNMCTERYNESINTACDIFNIKMQTELELIRSIDSGELYNEIDSLKGKYSLIIFKFKNTFENCCYDAIINQIEWKLLVVEKEKNKWKELIDSLNNLGKDNTTVVLEDIEDKKNGK